MGRALVFLFVVMFFIFFLFAVYAAIRNIVEALGSGRRKPQVALPDAGEKTDIDELERLGNLYERGLLTVEEFREMKRKVIEEK